MTCPVYLVKLRSTYIRALRICPGLAALLKLNTYSYPPPMVRIIVLIAVASLLVALAFVGLDARQSTAQTTTTDYDLDNDGLIEVRNAAQWQAIANDLNGDGIVATVVSPSPTPVWHSAGAYGDAADGAGCPLRDHDDDTSTAEISSCIGYELIDDITPPLNHFIDNIYTAMIKGNGFRLINARVNTVRSELALVAKTLSYTGEVQGLGLVNPVIWSNANGSRGLFFDRLEGTLIGSYVQGGSLEGDSAGGIAENVTTHATNGYGLIAHTYLQGVTIGGAWTGVHGGIAETFEHQRGTDPVNRATCLNSYFSGRLVGTGNDRGQIAYDNQNGGGANGSGRFLNCVADSTTSDRPAFRHRTPSGLNFLATKAQMTGAQSYDLPSTNNPFSEWDNYPADGTIERLAEGTSVDVWHFGDETNLPVLKGWGHDHTLALDRSASGADTVNLCTRTLAVANEIIRHLNDSDVLSGVSPTPNPLSLSPCTSPNDTRSVSITNLTNLVVTSPTNTFNLSPDRTRPESDRLTVLDWDDFAYLTNVSHIDLGGNELETLPIRLFQGLPLRWLDISNNNITSLHPDTFAGVAAVTTVGGNALLMNGNSLTDTGIPGRLFDGLTHLNGLDLSDNALTRVNTRWFEQLINLGRKAATTPPYTHALGLHLAGNTITEHYYSNKLFTGVRESVVSYIDTTANSVTTTAGAALNAAIISAIDAATASHTNLSIGPTATSFWFNSGTPAYQASTVTACTASLTAGPGRGDYLGGTLPGCQVQPHWTPPHKSTDTATATPAFGTTLGSRGELSIRVSHTTATTFVAYQLRHRPGNDERWTPWQVIPITLASGNKDFTVEALDSGISHQVELRALSTTGPPSAAAATTIRTTASNVLTGFTAATSTAAVGAIALSWNAITTSSLPTNHAVTAYYYRYKPQSATYYTAWRIVPDGDDSDALLNNETAVEVRYLNPNLTYDLQLVGAVDSDADGTLDYFSGRQSATATPLKIPDGLAASTGSVPGTIDLRWNLQTLAMSAQAKFQVRRKLRTRGSWSGVDWIDVPDSTGTGGDADTDAHNETGFTLTELQGGAEYDIQVRLYWDDTAMGQAPSMVRGTPLSPAAPTGLMATNAPGEAVLNWTQQSATMNADAKYQLRYKLASASWPETPAQGWFDIVSTHETDTVHVASLTPGSAYELELRFHWSDAVGAGPAATTTATPIAVPAPTGVSAVTGDAVGTIDVSWDPQTASTSPHARFQTRVRWSSGGTWTAWADVADGTDADSHRYDETSGTTGGWQYYREHDVQVRLAVGDTAGTAVQVDDIRAGYHPRNLRAVPGDVPGTIEITWDQQTVHTESWRRFNSSAAPTGTTSWGGWTNVTGGGSITGDTLTGLTKGSYYDVRVMFNLASEHDWPVGKSPAWPMPTVSNVQAAVVRPPTNFTATASTSAVNAIDLSWDQQMRSSVAASHFEYRVKATSSSTWPSTWENIGDGDDANSHTYDESSLTITALTSGGTALTANTSYDIQLRFHWNGTHGDSTSVSATATSSTIPSPPNFDAQTSAISNGVDLTWDLVAGATSYQYRYRLTSASGFPASGAGAWLEVPEHDSPSDGVANEDAETVTGLTGGSGYTFEIRAHTGASTFGTASAATATSQRLAAPTGFTASAGTNAGEISLSWTVPTTGNPDGFQYRYKLASAGSYVTSGSPTSTTAPWTNVPDGSDGDSMRNNETSYTIAGLLANISYEVQIRSQKAGPPEDFSLTGATTTATQTSMSLAAPASFAGAVGDMPGEVDLTWTAITTTLPNGDSVVQYQYRYKLSSATSFGSWTNIPAASTASHTVTGLSTYTSYDFDLRAAVDDGDDADTNVADYYSSVASDTAVFSGLARPSNVRVSFAQNPVPGTIPVVWNQQTVFGSTFTGAKFQVRWRFAGAGAFTNWTDAPNGRVSAGVNIRDQRAGQLFDVEVRFWASSSLISAAAATQGRAQVVDPPASLTATPDFGRVALSWTQQTAQTGTEAKYRLRYKKTSDPWPTSTGLGWADISGSTHSTNSHTVTGLDQGVQYDFEVAFHYTNAIGTSAASTVSSTPLTIAAPTGLNATTGDTAGEIEVSWDSQTAATSSDTKFQVRARPKDPAGAWIAWADVPDSTGPTGDAGTHLHDETSSNWFTGFTPYRPYDVEVRLVVGTALGPAATATDRRSGYYPRNLRATTSSSPGAIDVVWDEQTIYTDTNSQFRARAKLSSGSTWGSWVAVADSTDANSHLYDEQGVTLTGLTSGTNYDIQVAFRAGTTWANDSYLPTVSNVRSGIVQTPASFTAVTSTDAAGAVTLAWTAQTASSLADSKYQTRYRTAPSGAWSSWDDVEDGSDADSNDYNESGVVILGLTAGTSYNFQVRFHWSSTLGESSAASATATASAIPAPGSFSAASGTAPGSVDLSWNVVRGATDYQFRYKLKTAGSFPSTGAGAWDRVPDSDSDSDFGDETSHTITSGLTAGTEYTFELRVRVATTPGPASTDDGTAQTQPPPQNASFSAGTNAGEISITWDAPSTGTPTGYRYRYKLSSATSYPGTGTAITGSGAPWTEVPDSGSNGRQDERAYTITSLWGGVSYDVQIQAEAAVGNSLPGMGTTGTVIATAVAAPTMFNAGRGSGPGEIDLTWTALVANTMPTGHSVVQYQYRTKLGGALPTTFTNWTNIPAANTTSYTIGGLAAYTLHDVQLRATIDDGDADAVANYFSSSSQQAGIRTGLAVPGNLRATGGTNPGSLSLTWTEQTTFTRSTWANADYQYRTKLASAAASAYTSWTTITFSNAETATYTISNLMNGQLHDIQLRFRATSLLFSEGATVQGTPTALAVPTGLTASTAMTNVGAIDVEWTPQSAITVSTAEYQVRSKLRTGSWTGVTWTTVPDSTAANDPDTDRHDESAITLTGLNADQLYDVQVRFFMSSDIGGSTPANASATASSVPVPTGFDATTGSGAGEIDLTWTAITGATGYDYRYKRASDSSYPATGTGSWASAGTGTSFTVTNLSGGVFYDIQLRAKVTGIGDSAPTSAERAQAQTTPGPATLTFSQGPNPGDIKIDWTRPTPPAPAEHYEYRYKRETASDSAYSAWEKIPDDDNDGDFSDETTETISGLQAGVSYHVQFRVFASQAIGYSLPQRGTQASRPVPPPTSFTATGGTNPGEVDLSWTASAGVTILRYEVRHRLDPDGAWSGWANSGTTTTHSYTGLRAGMSRNFQVRAVMETVGASASVDATGTPTPVPTPGSFTASTGTFPGEIDLSWSAVTGSTSYEYRYKRDNIATWPDDAEWESVSGALTSTTLGTLDEGARYDIELRAAITNVGESMAAMGSAASRSATFTDEPTTPTISAAYSVSAAEVPGRIAIKLPGSGETFVHRHRTANPGEWSRWFKVTPGASDAQYLIPDLIPGVRYEIQVRAYTGMTTGFTTALVQEAQAAPLEAPEDFEAGESSGIILLQWSSPELYTPDSYEYRTRPTGTTTWSAWVNVEHEGDRGSTQRHWVVGLETGISHDFELRMQTQAGPSPIASSAGSARLRIAEVHSIRPVVRSVTVRAGDSIALTVDIYDTQQGLDNSIPGKDGSKLRFRWSEQRSAGGTFADPANTRRVTYTAPSTPGVYTVQAEAQPDGICTSHHEGTAEITATERAQCIAIFTVRVSAIPAETAPRPDPVNPTGTIPTSMTDNEGTSYAVFTPADGGTFRGTDITVTAPAAAVPDRTVVGIAATVSDIRPDDPIPGATMSVAGSFYDIRALADSGDPPLPSYTLNEPATACLPFPQEFRADLSNVVVVQRQPTGELSLLSTTIRSVAGEITACGTLTKLPATIGVARLGLVPAEPAPAQSITPDTPDTGATAPGFALLLLAFLVGMLLLTGISKMRRMIRR